MIIVVFSLLIVDISLACNIWGTDSGECSLLPLDRIWRSSNMPYCGDVVQYPTCIPKFQTLPPTREYPQGRWFNHTVINKDLWVGETAKEFVKYRMKLERNESLRSQGVNEYGDPVPIRKRFWHHPDCRLAFKNYFCWINFPRCDMKRDESLSTCRSACENYFISCGLDRDIWRCGPSKFFNGYEPEVPDVTQFGDVTYMRDYFPGQPFKANQYNAKGLEVHVCTPAIDGEGFSLTSRRISSTLLITIFISTLVILYSFL